MNAAFDFNVAGIEFIAAVLAAAAVFFHLPATVLRQGFWAAVNFLVLWLVLPNPASWIALAIFLGSGYIVAQVLHARPARWLLSSYLVVVVAAYIVLRQYPVLDWLLPHVIQEESMRILGVPIENGVLRHVIRILGISYMLFRQIHVLVDAAQGQIERLSLWSYVNYQVSLFTILAGPIQRFQDFEEQWRTLKPALADFFELLMNCQRLLWGVIKIALVAPLFFRGWDELAPQLAAGHYSGWKCAVYFAVVFYFYPIYLYCNFSGYCDIVIAANRFFGMKLPENFNRPWLARNVIEFWTRWHITLGAWIRDYLFMPMYKPVVERWPQRAQNWAWLFYFLAFIVAGAWHGTTLNFLCYGVLQGFGMSATKIYETWLLKRRGRNGLRQYMQSRTTCFVAILANYHFQCLSMLIFSQRDVLDAWYLVRAPVRGFDGARLITKSFIAGYIHEPKKQNLGRSLGILCTQAPAALLPISAGAWLPYRPFNPGRRKRHRRLVQGLLRMAMNGTSEALRTARLWQPLVCLSLLATIGLSILAIESAVHSEAFGAWMDREWAKANDTSNEYKRQFLDTEDRVVLEDMTDLDASRGGVYFFGASNMKWSMRVPDLPPNEQNLVHNFGTGEGSPYFNRQLTEYLVKYNKLLQADPEKTLIVYGTSFMNARPSVDSPSELFPNLWRRYGLYRYDYQTGIEPITRGSRLDAYFLEKARCSSFIQGVIDKAGRLAVPKALRRRKTEKDPAAFAADYRRRMGSDWEKNIDLHQQQLQAWFDYVKLKKMNFAVVLLPLASWHQPLPYPPKYRAMIEEFCKQNRNADGQEVPLYDLSAIAGDDDFGDHIHMNEHGLVKTDAALMDIARKFLEKTGAWPNQQ